MITSQIISWMGVSTLIASLLALGVLAIRNRLSPVIGARCVLLLWSIPALRLVMPPLPRREDQLSSLNAIPAEEFAGTAAPIELATLVPLPFQPAPAEAISQPTELWSTLNWSVVGLIVLMIWAVGAIVYFGRIALLTAKFRRAVTLTQTALPGSLNDLAHAAAKEAGLRRRPLTVLSEIVETPQITGFLTPLVVLPPRFSDDYSLDEQRHALLHEFTHARRGDLVTAWLATGLTAIQWFNPLAHVALSAFRIDQEAACDEAVRAIGVNSGDYAATLVKSVRLGQTHAPALSLNHGLHDRLRRMARPLPPAQFAKWATALIAASAVAGAAGTAGSFSVQTTRADEPAVDLEKELSGQQADVKAGKREEAQSRSGHYTITTEDGKIFIQKDGGKPRMLDFTQGLKPANVSVQNNNGHVTVDISDDRGNHQHHEFDIEDLAGGLPVMISGKDLEFYPHHRDRDQQLFLIGDPFDDIEPPENPAIEEVMKNMPEPPPAPEPPPSPKPKKVEGGQWVFIPDAPDMTEFEAEMNKFEFRMGDFSTQMEAFGADMEKFGQRMERVGKTVEALATECDTHLSQSSTLKIVRRKNPEAKGDVKALCVPTGEARPGKDEIAQFIRRQRRLSTGEKTALLSEGGWD
ncbi:MAG: M56 family metallopeptidase [Parvularcula sp.]